MTISAIPVDKRARYLRGAGAMLGAAIIIASGVYLIRQQTVVAEIDHP